MACVMRSLNESIKRLSDPRLPLGIVPAGLLCSLLGRVQYKIPNEVDESLHSFPRLLWRNSSLLCYSRIDEANINSMSKPASISFCGMTLKWVDFWIFARKLHSDQKTRLWCLPRHWENQTGFVLSPQPVPRVGVWGQFLSFLIA